MSLLFVALSLLASARVGSAGGDAATMLQVDARVTPSNQLSLDGPQAQLLQAVEQAYKKIRETSGRQGYSQVPAEVQDTITNTINAISEKASSYVLDNKAILQFSIREALTQVETRTATAAESKAAADQLDEAVVACRAEEQQVLVSTDEVMDKLRELQDDKNRFCPFVSQVALSKGDKQALEKTSEGTVTSCEAARKALDGFLTDEANAEALKSGGFTKQKQICDELNGQSLVSMCGFGDRLQQKCAAADKFQETQSGAKQSFEQLKAHWESMQQIKCTLQRFQASTGVTLEAGIPAACDLTNNATTMPDFAEEAGELDMRDAGFAAVMQEKNFTCMESKVAFSGKKWLTGSEGYMYFQVRYTPKLALLPVGSYPFEFCAPGELPEAPGGKATGSIMIQLEDPEAFVANEQAQAGMAGAVAEMSGIPVQTFTLTLSTGAAKQAYGEDADVQSNYAVAVFDLNIPKGKPFEDVMDDFGDLGEISKATQIIQAALREANATVPEFLNLTVTAPDNLHAPQAGFCVDGYELYEGVLSDNFGECEGTVQNGTCILEIEQAMKLCASSSRCAGLVDTTDPVWLARHERHASCDGARCTRVVGIGTMPLVSNSLWKACLKPAAAAAAAARPGEVCSTSVNATQCDAPATLREDASMALGNTTDECCA